MEVYVTYIIVGTKFEKLFQKFLESKEKIPMNVSNDNSRDEDNTNDVMEAKLEEKARTIKLQEEVVKTKEEPYTN
jgi:hypothetical protein